MPRRVAIVAALLSLPAVVRAADTSHFLPQKAVPVDKSEPTRDLLATWWAHIEWCLGADLLAPACQAFWAWTIGALLIVAVLVLAWMVLKFISYKMKLAAALRAERERAKIADGGTMRAHTWEGDKAYQTDLQTEDVERSIKDALGARANEGRPPPAGG